MKRILNYEITKEYAGQPVLFFLKQHGFSQQIVTHLKKTENGILLNGIWARVWDIKGKRWAYSDNNRNRLFGKYRSGQASISDCIRR